MLTRSCSASKQEVELRRSFSSIDEFCKANNPDMQLSLCADQGKCFFGNFPTLALLRRAYGVSASYWLVPQLVNLSQFCGCKDKLKGEPLEECAELIAQQFYFLKTSELMLFFYRFKSGRYGRFYGAVDPLVIMQALRDFVRERDAAYAHHESEMRMRQMEADSQNAVSYEEYRELKGGTGMNDDIVPACGSCAHCDQLHNGFYRYCEVRRINVYALSRRVCAKYADLWERDLFGRFFRYEKMKAAGKVK